MILTNINDIDKLALEFLTLQGVINLDMNDYNLIKKSSNSIKAVKVEEKICNTELINAFNDEIKQVGKENVRNLLFYVAGNENDSEFQNITCETMSTFQKIDFDDLDDANIIWGIGNNPNKDSNITLIAIIGY